LLNFIARCFSTGFCKIVGKLYKLFSFHIL
jgi:hypothetical protein